MLRIPPRLTIRSQILALMFAVIVPSAAAVGWALSAVLASEKVAAEARVKASAAQVASNLGQFLHEREDLLVTLAALTSQRFAAGTDPCVALAAARARLLADRSDLADLAERTPPALHDPSGRWLCGIGPDPLAGSTMSDSAWFRRGLQADGFVVGPVQRLAADRRWAAPLTVPLHDAAGQPAGLLVLALDVLATQPRVMAGASSPTLLAVIDGDEALAMRSVDAAKWLGTPTPPQLAAASRGQRDAVLTLEGLDGRRRLWAIVGVQDASWRVVAGVPEDDVLARYHALLRTSALAGGLGLALVMALAWRLGSRIVRPVRALAETSARVAAGDLSARAEPTGPAEIEAVASQFNQMLDAGRASQQALRASESQLRFLVDHLFAGLVVHASDTTVLLCNARAGELLGLSVAQMSGQAPIDPAWRFLGEDGRPMTAAEYPVMRVLTSRRPLTDCVLAIDRAGDTERVWVLVNAYPRFDDGGSLFQVVVSFVDITAFKKAEQTLVANERRYRMVVDTSLDGVLQTRPGGGSVLAANPAACAIFGLSEAALCARGRVGLADAADPRLTGLLAQRARYGRASGRTTMLRGDGSPFEAEVASALYTGADGEALASIVVRDLSRQLADEQERTRLEGQLRESQKMEAIGTLAGGIAHDFNNILGGLLGNADLAGDALPAGHPAHAHLQQISRAGQRARALVQQILAFSRRQGPPTVQQRQPLRPLVEETLALMRATLPAGVRLDADLADEPIEVACDATQIQQVLMNLCTNAWHALDGKPGRIELRLVRVDVDAADPRRPIRLGAGAFARLQVIDDGHGMDEATRQHIFEPFFTTKPVGKGTGLGLSVVHGIVTAHGGEIVVHSCPGEGSRFDVFLPLATAPPAAAVPGPPVPAVAGQGQHVLCVDDDEVMLLMTGQLLERAGYRVTSLLRVADALAALRLAPQAFDLVVTDFNMPEGSGLDIARESLQLRPDLPVVLSSGYLPEDLRHQALAAGVRAILMKEHTVEELPALVARLLATPA